MNLQKLDGGIIFRVLIVFITGIIYGILDKGKFNGSFIGDGLAYLVISYVLGFISFYIYRFISKKKFENNKRKINIWNTSILWALFILILGIL